MTKGIYSHRPDLVVIGNAISRGNPEAEYVLDQVALLLTLALLANFSFRQAFRSSSPARTARPPRPRC